MGSFVLSRLWDGGEWSQGPRKSGVVAQSSSELGASLSGSAPGGAQTIRLCWPSPCRLVEQAASSGPAKWVKGHHQTGFLRSTRTLGKPQERGKKELLSRQLQKGTPLRQPWLGGRGGWQLGTEAQKTPMDPESTGTKSVGEASATCPGKPLGRSEHPCLQRDFNVVSRSKSTCLIPRTTAVSLSV